MKFKLLGNSGLRVSEMALGAMTFGSDWGWGADKKESRRISGLEQHIAAAAVEIDYGDGRPLGLNVSATDERIAPISAVLETIADPRWRCSCKR